MNKIVGLAGVLTLSASVYAAGYAETPVVVASDGYDVICVQLAVGGQPIGPRPCVPVPVSPPQ